jgi:zinc finger SWIM domain-containing protein 3
MTLVELFQHFDNCLEKLQTREATLDFVSNYTPCLEPDASFFVHEALKRFTTSVFYDDVLYMYSLKAAEKCYLIEELDSYETVVHEVRRVDKGEKRYYVSCDICVDVDKVNEISCSCLKLQSLGTPCSHIFFVLHYRRENKLPDCCVLERWKMGAKRGFPPTRKSTMYDYSDSVQRYNDLHNIGRTAAFTAAQSQEAFERLKHVLEEEAATVPVNIGEGGRKTFGPVLPQALDVDSAE